jgi:hypothetical protein
MPSKGRFASRESEIEDAVLEDATRVSGDVPAIQITASGLSLEFR